MDERTTDAEDVLQRVRANGGHLTVSERDGEDLAAWRHAAKVAQLGLLRAGRERLRWSSPAPGTFTLVLVELDADGREQRPTRPKPRPAGPPSSPPVLTPRTGEFRGRKVPVPSTLRSPDPIVDQLADALEHPDRMIYGFERTVVPIRQYPVQRMRKIWQAIITEARFRGYKASFRHDRTDRYSHGQLLVTIGPDDFPLELYGKISKPLCLRVRAQHPKRRRGFETWTDSPQLPLQKQLGEVFTGIELWAELLIAQREKQDRADQERTRRRELLQADARRQFAEHHRRETLTGRITDRWFAADARRYTAALTAAAGDLPPERATDVREWARWILQHADDLDEQATRGGMPELPPATYSDLKPYMPLGYW
jgi:hypothetical protein